MLSWSTPCARWPAARSRSARSGAWRACVVSMCCWSAPRARARARSEALAAGALRARQSHQSQRKPPAHAGAPPFPSPACRTYPEGYKPPDEGPSEYQTIPLSKIEDFGVHAKQVGFKHWCRVHLL